MRAFPYKNLTEFKVFKKYNTPQKIQDFINSIPINFELDSETYYRPLQTLKNNKAHCMEGALLAAAMLWYHGQKPLLLDLKTTDEDVDHVVTLFKDGKYWGAISKSNHNVLRYRDPIYKNIRELVLSYFNEYFDKNKNKSLREYSRPFSLLKYDDSWLIDEKDAWNIVYDLDDSPHIKIIPKNIVKKLRKVDDLEYTNSLPTEWQEK